MTVCTALAGRLPQGDPVLAHTLDAGEDGLALQVVELGASVASLHVPDRRGERRDVVLGIARIEDRLASTDYLGTTVGRYANRITEGTFTLDGCTHTVPPNEGRHALP